jgi:hypothetical protein
MSEWLPIETAPKDETLILLYGRVHNKTLVSAGLLVLPTEDNYDPDWSYPRHVCLDVDGEPSVCHPTHWMPLPSLPSSPS